jgi:S-methylmethionine-dependent homocysteine/selenocysteine methylase
MDNQTALYRNHLPQLGDKKFLTDGGLETTLIFHHDIDLPLFAAFDLLKSEPGKRTIREYYLPYIDIALAHQVGFILESPTWRASTGWGVQIGYEHDEIEQANREAIAILEQLRQQYASVETPIVVSGNIGPIADGYSSETKVSADEAETYHRHQIEVFAGSSADMVNAITMTYVDEAVGIVRAAQKAGIPVSIGFTVETDGRLPDGTPLGQAIQTVDKRTNGGPVYYLVNCAHPSHFSHVLEEDQDWSKRIYGVRANASCKSHAELDESETLDDGDPVAFGALHSQLCEQLSELRIMGGCCGTDHRHVASIAQHCCQG